MTQDSRRRVRFTAPGEVDVVTEEAPTPSSTQVRVRTRYSAVSPGTERLVLQGKVSEGVQTDPTLEAFEEEAFSYPFSYGYSCVGTVEDIGESVGADWLGARVFGFYPHASRFVADPGELIRLPESVRARDAVMIPSLETAVNLVMDGRPVIGESTIVFGLGVVGLLTTRLLFEYPLESLIGIDPVSARRSVAEEFGATHVADPAEGVERIRKLSSPTTGDTGDREGCDLVYELTGDPSVLSDAIGCTGFEGRIVVGSWYGTKTAAVDLGSHFHRSRINISSSQVSTIASVYQGRWTKSRRLSVVLRLLSQVAPSQLITDIYQVERAPLVYEKLSSKHETLVQPVFSYS